MYACVCLHERTVHACVCVCKGGLWTCDNVGVKMLVWVGLHGMVHCQGPNRALYQAIVVVG